MSESLDDITIVNIVLCSHLGNNYSDIVRDMPEGLYNCCLSLSLRLNLYVIVPSELVMYHITDMSLPNWPRSAYNVYIDYLHQIQSIFTFNK